MRGAWSLATFAAVTAILSGCSSKDKGETETNVVPTRYKQEVIETLRTSIFTKNETKTVTNAMITDPVLRGTGSDQHYSVCVRYTAHGTLYNISADAERIGFFYSGHLNQLIDAENGECKNAPYKPFPELNAVCTGTGCSSR